MLSSESGFMAFITAWIEAMGRACWQGAVAVLAIWLLCRFFPRLSPRVQCWLWRLVYLKIAIAFFGVKPVDLPLLPPESSSSYLMADTTFPDTQPNEKTPFAMMKSQTSSPLALVPVVLFGFWLIGGGWQVWGLMCEGRKARALLRRGQAVDDSALLRECQELCHQFGIRRSPQLLMVAGEGGPLLVGALRPVILLPETLWNDSPPQQQRMLLAHELAHLQRRDLLWAWVPTLGRCVFFFHPLVWLAEREWQQSQEMACDDQALRLTAGSRSDYGAILLKIALQPSSQLPSGRMAMHVAESYTTVRRRLLAMKQTRSTSRRYLLMAGALIGALGLVGIVPWRVSAQDTTKAERERERLEKVKVARGMIAQPPLLKRLAVTLELNAGQVDRVSAIHKSLHEQIEQTLTPEQRERLLKGLNFKVDPMSQLDLTNVQEQQLKATYAVIEAKIHALKLDETLTMEQKEARMRELEDALKLQRHQLLTPEQRKKMEAQMVLRQKSSNSLNLTQEQQEMALKIKHDVGERMQGIMDEPTLSKEEKKIQVEQLTREAQALFMKILTPEQRQQQIQREQEEQEVAAQGPYGLARLERLGNLTNAQKARVRALRADAERQFEQILTASQKQKYRQWRGENQSL
jgi:beta-lactamase regulating signal transducer with metallopeptidase domain